MIPRCLGPTQCVLELIGFSKEALPQCSVKVLKGFLEVSSPPVADVCIPVYRYMCCQETC